MKDLSFLNAILAVVLLSTMGCAAVPEPFEEETKSDGGALTKCRSKGGICTASPDIICATDAQPLTQNDPENTDCDGHCCMKTEINMCVENLEWTCVPGACAGGWAAVEGAPFCPEGRACCYWAQ